LSPLGQHVRQVMAGGAVVEDDVILGLVRTAMLRAIKHGTVGFVIDNFPIEIQQVRTKGVWHGVSKGVVRRL
jgi:adenylate kinase family enzyme